MKEYKNKNITVRIHGEIDKERFIESAKRFMYQVEKQKCGRENYSGREVGMNEPTNPKRNDKR